MSLIMLDEKIRLKFAQVQQRRINDHIREDIGHEAHKKATLMYGKKTKKSENLSSKNVARLCKMQYNFSAKNVAGL